MSDAGKNKEDKQRRAKRNRKIKGVVEYSNKGISAKDSKQKEEAHLFLTRVPPKKNYQHANPRMFKNIWRHIMLNIRTGHETNRKKCLQVRAQKKFVVSAHVEFMAFWCRAYTAALCCQLLLIQQWFLIFECQERANIDA